VRPPALVCEYLPHGSLRSALNARAEWLAAPQAKVKLLLDTARGLDYLHSKVRAPYKLRCSCRPQLAPAHRPASAWFPHCLA
jgi:hypothetical protein